MTEQRRQAIQEALRNLPGAPTAQAKFDQLLANIAHDLELCKSQLKKMSEEQAEILRTGYLLSLIDIGDAKWISTVTNHRIVQAIQTIKKHWGDRFFYDLRVRNVFLSSLLSRDIADLLKRIAQSHNVEIFCAAIRPILQKPRNKGRSKGREGVPALAGRLVQAQDLKDALAALSTKAESEVASSPTGDQQTEESSLDKLDGRFDDDDDDDDVYQPPEYPRGHDPTYSGSASSSPLDDVPSDDAPLEHQPSDDMPSERLHFDDVPSDSPPLLAEDFATAHNSRINYDNDNSLEHQKAKTCGQEKMDYHLIGGSLTEQVIYQDLPKIMVPEMASASKRKRSASTSQSSTGPFKCRTLSSSFQRIESTIEESAGSAAHLRQSGDEESSPPLPSVLKPWPSSCRLEVCEAQIASAGTIIKASTHGSVLEDLSPARWLHGSTIHSIIRTFVPRSVLGMIEVGKDPSLRTEVDKFISRGPAVRTDFACILCLKQHWVGILYKGDCHTLSLTDSFHGYISPEQLQGYMRDIGLAITDTMNNGSPKTTKYTTPQQENTFDCGVYLVMSLIREVAKSNISVVESGATPIPAQGHFFRTILRDFFCATHDLETTFEVLLSTKMGDVDNSVAVSIRLQKNRSLVETLKGNEILGTSTIQIFKALKAVLGRERGRMATQVMQVETLAKALAESQPAFETYVQRRSAAIEEGFRIVEDKTNATIQQLRQGITELQCAEEASCEMVSRLDSLLTGLQKVLGKTIAAIQQQEIEARELKREKEKKIMELSQELEKEKRMVSDLTTVLRAGE